MKRSQILFSLLRIPSDFLMVVLGFLLGYQLRLEGDFIPGIELQLNAEELISIQEFLGYTLTFATLLIIVFAIFGLYDLKNKRSWLNEMRRTTTHSLLWVLVVMAYFFVTREIFFSRLTLGFGVLLSIVFILTGRSVLDIIQYHFLKVGIGRRRVLLIGGNEITEKLAHNMLNDPHYEPVGFLHNRHKKIDGLKRLGSLNDLKKVIRRYKVEEILQTDQKLSEVQDQDILSFCQEKHIEYYFVPDILAVERSNIEVQTLSGLPIIHLKPTPLDGWGKVYKRTSDIIISLIALILLSPLFLIVALAIKIDSKGPVFFSRLPNGKPAYRIGQKGRKFQFYKFRSMVADAHNKRKELAHKSHRTGPLFKIKNDPRITKVGGFLRKTSIDELPNLWNVLKGDMSLVGPRPHLPEEVEEYEDHHKFTLTIKPGITGLSQINGRSDLDFEKEVRLDTYYIKHWSPLLDLKILLKTIFVVIGGKAAD